MTLVRFFLEKITYVTPSSGTRTTDSGRQCVHAGKTEERAPAGGPCRLPVPESVHHARVGAGRGRLSGWRLFITRATGDQAIAEGRRGSLTGGTSRHCASFSSRPHDGGGAGVREWGCWGLGVVGGRGGHRRGRRRSGWWREAAAFRVWVAGGGMPPLPPAI